MVTGDEKGLDQPPGRRERPRTTVSARALRLEALGVFALLAVYGLLLATLASRVDVTSDERSYLFAGRWLMTHGTWGPLSTRLHGPVPFLANQLLSADVASDDYSFAAVERARLPMLAFGLLAGSVVFLWSRAAFGRAAAFLSLTLFVFDPMMLAYGPLVAVDMCHSAFAVLTLFLLWRYGKRPSLLRLLWVGVVLGIAFATKYLTLFYGPLVVVGVASFTFSKLRRGGATPQRGTWQLALFGALAASLLVTVLSLVTLHACYGFRGGLAWSLGSPRSAAMSELTRVPVAALPLRLLPQPYWRGLDYQIETSQGSHQIYLNGALAAGHWDYYLWSFLLKTPEIVILLLAFVLIRRSHRWAPDSATGWIATAGILLPLVYLSLFHPLQIGIRYMLPAYPLLFVLLGGALCDPWLSRPLRAATTTFVVGIYCLASVAGQWPNLLGYYNFLAGGPAHGYRHFHESNTDWGQLKDEGLRVLCETEERPFVVLWPRAGPRFGRVALYIGDMDWPDPENPARSRHWVEAFEPVRNVGPAWLLFDVTPQAYESAVSAGNDPRVRADLALAYLAAGDRAGFARHVSRLDETTARPLRQLARLRSEYERTGRFAVLLQLAGGWAALGRPDLSFGLLSQERLPESPERTLGLAASLVAWHKPEEALSVLEASPEGKSDPRHVVALASLYNQTLRFDETIALLGGSDGVVTEIDSETRRRLIDHAVRFRDELGDLRFTLMTLAPAAARPPCERFRDGRGSR